MYRGLEIWYYPNMSEKKKGKFQIGPTMSISGGKFKPDEQVNVKTIYGQYGLKGQYESGDKKLRISGSITKDVTKGKVDFPGGSEKFKAESKPYYRIDIEKKFGGPDPKKDLSKFIDSKVAGGLIKGFPKLTKKGWK